MQILSRNPSKGGLKLSSFDQEEPKTSSNSSPVENLQGKTEIESLNLTEAEHGMWKKVYLL